MKIIVEKGLRVYYYRDLEDLKLVENELNSWKIDFHFNYETNPCRICPRGENHVVLFKNTGNIENDLKKLNSNLSIFNIEGIEEL